MPLPWDLTLHIIFIMPFAMGLYPTHNFHNALAMGPYPTHNFHNDLAMGLYLTHNFHNALCHGALPYT